MSIVSWAFFSFPSSMSHADFFLVADRPAFISVPEDLKSGLTMAHVQRADKYGGGFAVNIEAMHTIHCLVSHPPPAVLIVCNDEALTHV